jgi:hypothetical protein
MIRVQLPCGGTSDRAEYEVSAFLLVLAEIGYSAPEEKHITRFSGRVAHSFLSISSRNVAARTASRLLSGQLRS